MQKKRSGALSYLFYWLAFIAIWLSVFLNSYHKVYPEIPDTGRILHFVSLALFGLGWSARRQVVVPRVPARDVRFAMNKFLQTTLVLLVFPLAFAMTFSPHFVGDPMQVIDFEWFAFAACAIIVVIVSMLRIGYNSMLRKYGVRDEIQPTS